MADSSKNQLHSHRNVLAESANPQQADFGVTAALQSISIVTFTQVKNMSTFSTTGRNHFQDF